jgi:hypothetical protein
VPAAEPGSAFIRYVIRPIEDVLCIQEDRRWRRQLRRLEPGAACRFRRSNIDGTVRATVRVHEYPDGCLAILDGPRCLARFDQKARNRDVVSQAA